MLQLRSLSPISLKHPVLLSHAEIQISDDLLQDNRRSAAISVIEQIKVLLVDGDPSEEWLRGETDFLKLALTPFEESKEKNSKESVTKGGEMKDLINAISLTSDEFNKINSLSEYSLIILSNLQSLEAEKAKEIALPKRRVLICSGNQMQIEWYNNTLGSTGSNSLPMPIKEHREICKTS